MDILASRQNPLVKEMRKLHSAKGRDRQKQFLLEGTHLLEAALEANYPLMAVCCTPKWQERHGQLWEELKKQARRSVLASESVLEAIATTMQPDGIVATAQRRTTELSPIATSGVALALETIQDPGNLGAIIRTAAAAGADGLWLSADSVDLDSPKVLRASAGQWFRLPMAVSSDLKTRVIDCRSQGMQVIATRSNAPVTYWEIDYRRPTLILLGNEGAGLSAELSAIADFQVRIPLMAGVESLNVAIAAALVLYEALRQREQS